MHLTCLPSISRQRGLASPEASPLWPRSHSFRKKRAPLDRGALSTRPRWAQCPVVPFVSPRRARYHPELWGRARDCLAARSWALARAAATWDPLPHWRVSITWRPRQAPGTNPAPPVLPGFASIVNLEITSLSPATTGSSPRVRARLPASRSLLTICVRFLGAEARSTPLPTPRNLSRFGTVFSRLFSQALPHDRLRLSQLSSSRSAV